MALTFQKLFSVLHGAIADQALFLWDALGHCRGNCATVLTTTAAMMAKWEMFAINLPLTTMGGRYYLSKGNLDVCSCRCRASPNTIASRAIM